MEKKDGTEDHKAENFELDEAEKVIFEGFQNLLRKEDLENIERIKAGKDEL